MIRWIVAPLLFFLIGFLLGYWTSRAMWLLGARVIVGAVLWLPIVALLLLQYAEVIDPDTLSLVSAFLPRVIELPAIGFLIGYTLKTVLGVVRREGRHG